MDVRGRAREAFRAELAEAVLAVFAEHGFHNVTVEQAAHAVGISRATFFRHLGTKEDAVILAVEFSSIDYAEVIRALPSGDPRSGWALVRVAVEPTVLRVEDDPARQLSRLEVINAEPSLRAKLAESRLEKVERLGKAIGERMDDALGARVLAATGMAAFDLSWSEWIADPATSFRDVVDRIFGRLGA
ncbi:TetR/AcrR family transcriptional regulator [Microbacterium sp. Root61]|uniref:TetR/AcrR family transcriptional regulator n=1 Tax=Microbacterium sp. Root61 TaxID=1736570 RepID=UPI000B3360AD|nr:TetR/AcrR family transcriptional regulator [Microbacterium sp. Root61]